ncbi:Pfs, NB-ARC and TPR domain protein [Aspergillus venezuelensis]
MARKIRLGHDDYTVAWICAIPLEMAAATAMLDEVHQDLPVQSNDHNSYALGRIFEHNVVIACLPSGKYGTVSASSVVVQLLSSFRSVRFGLMVGIGGGVPTSGADIRLGDIVVSKPTDTHGGVIEYDYGKVLSDGNLKRTGMLSRPPQVLLTALSRLQAHHINNRFQFLEYFKEFEDSSADRDSNFTRPLQEDRLYLPTYVHKDVESTTCASCDSSRTVRRPPRKHDKPVVHYGLIASANQVVKDSGLRDKLGHALGAHCVEMEAAGVMDNLPCLVIRGICDYADSHKNDKWQGYASGIAAAYGKELLLFTAVAQSKQWEKFHVPFSITSISAVDNFIGRENELEELWDHLRPSRQGSRKVAALHALGGMGKTQLAAHFARIHRDDFTAAFWLNGKSRETLIQSLGSVIFQLPGHGSDVTTRNEEEVQQDSINVLRWLAMAENNKWLLIFDNVNLYSSDTENGYQIEDFFPKADHGSILITSRFLKSSELGKSIPLKKLCSEHTIQLLLQTSGFSLQDVNTTDQNAYDVANLVNYLDGLPLSITAAGTFIRGTGTSFGKYIQYYRESWLSLQSHSEPNRHYEHGNILQTWLISYNEINRRDPDAAKLLLLLAHYHYRDIWYELLASGTWRQNSPEWLTRIIFPEFNFREKMKTLIGFSFVGVNIQNDSYTMHPVVRDWCLSVPDKTAADQLDELALVSVARLIPTSNGPNLWRLQNRLLAHVDYILGRLGSVTLLPNYDIWQSLFQCGYLYYAQCRFGNAAWAYHWAQEMCKKTMVSTYSSDRNFIYLRRSLAELYIIQGKPVDAKEELERALAECANLPPEDPLVPFIMTSLGVAYSNNLEHNKAEETLKKAQSAFIAICGPEHIWSVDCLEKLGRVYTSNGQPEVAEPMCRAALEAKIKLLGPNDISTLESFSQLGHALQSLGRFEESEDMFLKGFAMQDTYGPDNPLVLYHTRTFAWVLEKLGKLIMAESMYSRTSTGFERSLGAGHSETIRAMVRYGDFLMRKGRSGSAETEYERAYMNCKIALGPDHPSTQAAARKLEQAARAFQQLQTQTQEPHSCGFLPKLFRRRQSK